MKERDTVNSKVRRAIEEIMLPGEELGVQEIRQLLLEKKGLVYGEDYREGHLSSALHTLPDKGILTKVRRGVYKKTDAVNRSAADSENLKDKAVIVYEIEDISKAYERQKETLKRTLQEMCSVLQNVNLGEISEQEFETLKGPVTLKNKLSDILKELE